MKRVALAALLLLLLTPFPSAAAGEYRTLEVQSLRITIDSEWGSRLAPGYLPVRFDITNLGEARVIEIVGEGTRYSRFVRSVANVHVRRSLPMARGDRVRVTLPIPVFADSENLRFEIQEHGETLERFNYMTFQSAAAPADASVLIVAASSTPFGKAAGTLPRPPSPAAGGLSAPGGTLATVDFVLEPARLPANWIGYTSVRAVVIGAAEFGMLEDAQKDALLTWAASGGTLIVEAGDGALRGAADSLAPDAAADGSGVAYFFGRISRRPSAAIASAGLAAALVDAERTQDESWALPVNRSGASFRVAIPGVNGVPRRAYLSILILFTLLIGPVNYWVLWRRRRPVLFVLTAPLTSAMFIVLLAGYVIAAEGFHVSGRALTLTMLDQARKQAVTRGRFSLYAAGMTPGGGLRFPRDVAVFPVVADGRSGGSRQILDLTETQQFASGLIQARAQSDLEQVAFRAARERLTFERDASGVRVTNGLGARIQSLVFRSHGAVYALEAPLADGATAALKSGRVDAQALASRDIPAPPLFFTRLLQSQPDGSYVALLDSSPFWEPGVTGVLERGSFHVVLGWPDGQPGQPARPAQP